MVCRGYDGTKFRRSLSCNCFALVAKTSARIAVRDKIESRLREKLEVNRKVSFILAVVRYFSRPSNASLEQYYEFLTEMIKIRFYVNGTPSR